MHLECPSRGGRRLCSTGYGAISSGARRTGKPHTRVPAKTSKKSRTVVAFVTNRRAAAAGSQLCSIVDSLL